MEVKGYTLVNEEKVNRVLEGTLDNKGQMVGGLPKDDEGNVDEDALLAGYDKLGGLIKKGNDTVKTGSFYDFKTKQAKKNPDVVFVFRINNKVVEVAEGAETPRIVEAARALEEERVEEAPKRKRSK